MKYQHSVANIIAMDETPVWADMVSTVTVKDSCKKTVTVKPTGRDESHVLVCFAVKIDGTKLPPFIVFKGAKARTCLIRCRNKNCFIVPFSNA